MYSAACSPLPMLPACMYVSQPKYRDMECVQEHQAILDAALASDLDALRKAIEVHLENSNKALRLIFKVNQMVNPN